MRIAMKPVKTLPRFQCDFCKRRSTKSVMEKHEKRCFRNPNRYCDNCDNTGKVEHEENGSRFELPCEYCSRRDPEIEKGIKEYEASKKA